MWPALNAMSRRRWGWSHILSWSSTDSVTDAQIDSVSRDRKTPLSGNFIPRGSFCHLLEIQKLSTGNLECSTKPGGVLSILSTKISLIYKCLCPYTVFLKALKTYFLNQLNGSYVNTLFSSRLWTFGYFTGGVLLSDLKWQGSVRKSSNQESATFESKLDDSCWVVWLPSIKADSLCSQFSCQAKLTGCLLWLHI